MQRCGRLLGRLVPVGALLALTEGLHSPHPQLFVDLLLALVQPSHRGRIGREFA